MDLQERVKRSVLRIRKVVAAGSTKVDRVVRLLKGHHNAVTSNGGDLGKSVASGKGIILMCGSVTLEYRGYKYRI